jgi:hypothetical protein
MKLIIINTGICTTTIKGKEYFQVGLTIRDRETDDGLLEVHRTFAWNYEKDDYETTFKMYLYTDKALNIIKDVRFINIIASYNADDNELEFDLDDTDLEEQMLKELKKRYYDNMYLSEYKMGHTAY